MTEMRDDILDCARETEDTFQRLARITIDRPGLTPADIDLVIAHLPDGYRSSSGSHPARRHAPPRAGRLARHLDSMRDTHDPSIAIDTARLHLDAMRRPAVEVHRRLDAAHQDTAYIAAAGLSWIEARSDG